MNADVKPPAARATPVATSMAIQMPQGYWSSRLVTAPRPKNSRTASTASPAAATTAMPITPGVKKGTVERPNSGAGRS